MGNSRAFVCGPVIVGCTIVRQPRITRCRHVSTHLFTKTGASSTPRVNDRVLWTHPSRRAGESNTVTKDAHICTTRASCTAIDFATGGELAATAMFWDSANDAVMNDGRHVDAACRSSLPRSPRSPLLQCIGLSNGAQAATRQGDNPRARNNTPPSTPAHHTDNASRARPTLAPAHIPAEADARRRHRRRQRRRNDGPATAPAVRAPAETAAKAQGWPRRPHRPTAWRRRHRNQELVRLPALAGNAHRLPRRAQQKAAAREQAAANGHVHVHDAALASGAAGVAEAPHDQQVAAQQQRRRRPHRADHPTATPCAPFMPLAQPDTTELLETVSTPYCNLIPTNYLPSRDLRSHTHTHTHHARAHTAPHATPTRHAPHTTRHKPHFACHLPRPHLGADLSTWTPFHLVGLCVTRCSVWWWPPASTATHNLH